MSPRELNHHLCKQQGKKNKPTSSRQKTRHTVHQGVGWGNSIGPEHLCSPLRNLCPEFHSRTSDLFCFALFGFPRLCATMLHKMQLEWEKVRKFCLPEHREAFREMCVSSIHISCIRHIQEPPMAMLPLQEYFYYM